MDDNAARWSSGYFQGGLKNFLTPLSTIPFRIAYISVRGNGTLIKEFATDLPEILTNRRSVSLEDSVWCMERLLAVENNSDTTYQNFINDFGSSSVNEVNPLQICLANGGLFKRMLRPNVNGFTNIRINLSITGTLFNRPINNRSFYVTRIYLKYLTQLLVDENFQVTLVNNPAISI